MLVEMRVVHSAVQTDALKDAALAVLWAAYSGRHLAVPSADGMVGSSGARMAAQLEVPKAGSLAFV
jgi:hypothetical protein